MPHSRASIQVVNWKGVLLPGLHSYSKTTPGVAGMLILEKRRKVSAETIYILLLCLWTA